MSNDTKMQSEDLKKLEDQAYFELCQIIAEAMQYQDVELLNSRIASWKNKYKKLLDRPSTNSKSDFKKRIEFLLTQYYSSVTQYILGQLKLKEEKQIENQSKALRELYSIIRDTNDYNLLKTKVNKWKEKYPLSGFLKMYQKRIELYTRDKNLKENAFNQEEAFSDLVDITKVHGTLDELKFELALWEEKYSINDKYSIDDFLKHQNEVKRFTSDEFLQSIAREEFDTTKETDIDIVEQYNTKSCSALSVQAAAYSSLLSITSKSDNVNELFNWVYKNRYINFNDKYKELILSATYLNYRPEYLKYLSIPNIDILNTSLTFNEYKNIDEIKRYAIISYFNLLLPPEKAMSNDYFNQHIHTIHSKSNNVKNELKNKSVSLEDTLETQEKLSVQKIIVTENPVKEDLDVSEIIIAETPEKEDIDVPEIIIAETPAKEDTDVAEIIIAETPAKEDTDVAEIIVAENPAKEDTDIAEIIVAETPTKEDTDVAEIIVAENPIKEDSDIPEIIVDLSDNESGLTINLENTGKITEIKVDTEDFSKSTDTLTEIKSDQISNLMDSNPKNLIEEGNKSNFSLDNNKEDSAIQIKKFENNKETLSHETIIAFSPIFIETINILNKQSVLIGHIDSTTNEYIESEKTNDISLNEQIKTKLDEE
jgi:hypothetical protein